jgi:putative hydrolase of the HAD superfamily
MEKTTADRRHRHGNVYSQHMTQRIDAVLFDAVGTLFTSRGAIGEIYRNVALRYGVDVPARTLQAGFAARTRHGETPVTRDGWKELVKAVFAVHGTFPHFEAFFTEVYDFFETGHGWICYPETVRVLGALTEHGVPTGIVSNFDRRLTGVLQDLGIAPYFSVVVTPDSAGQAKPDPRIFLDAVAQLDLDPRHVLFVGDDPSFDVAGARSAGLEAVLVDRHSTRQGPHSVPTLEGVIDRILPDTRRHPEGQAR